MRPAILLHLRSASFRAADRTLERSPRCRPGVLFVFLTACPTPRLSEPGLDRSRVLVGSSPGTPRQENVVFLPKTGRWRAGEEFTWRAVAQVPSELWCSEWGSNQLYSKDLCAAAAQVLGEASYREPNACPMASRDQPGGPDEDGGNMKSRSEEGGVPSHSGLPSHASFWAIDAAFDAIAPFACLTSERRRASAPLPLRFWLATRSEGCGITARTPLFAQVPQMAVGNRLGLAESDIGDIVFAESEQGGLRPESATPSIRVSEKE